jgi:hypothetical protein
VDTNGDWKAMTKAYAYFPTIAFFARTPRQSLAHFGRDLIMVLTMCLFVMPTSLMVTAHVASCNPPSSILGTGISVAPSDLSDGAIGSVALRSIGLAHRTVAYVATSKASANVMFSRRVRSAADGRTLPRLFVSGFSSRTPYPLRDTRAGDL